MSVALEALKFPHQTTAPISTDSVITKDFAEPNITQTLQFGNEVPSTSYDSSCGPRKIDEQEGSEPVETRKLNLSQSHVSESLEPLSTITLRSVDGTLVNEDDTHQADLALLNLLPQFAPYTYTSQVISDYGDQSTLGVRDRKRDTDGSPMSFVGNIAKDNTVFSRLYHRYNGGSALSEIANGELDDRMLFDLRLRFISPLQDIFRVGESLIHAELKVEDSYRQLTEIRKEMNQHVNKLIDLLSTVRFTSKKDHLTAHSSSYYLKEAMKSVEAEEKDLIFQQKQVTRHQGDLQKSADALFGALFDGRHLGGSQMEVEEELLAELAMQHLSTSSSSSHDFKSEIQTNQATAGFDSSKTHDYFDDITADQNGILQVTESDNRKVPKTEPGLLPPKSVKSRRASSRERPTTEQMPPLLAGFGSCFTNSVVTSEMMYSTIDISRGKSSSIDLIEIHPIFRIIRLEDLKPELSTFSEQDEPPSRRSLQRKLNDYNIAQLHQMDWAAMWGSSMSCNALSDLMWTINYDKPKEKERRMALGETTSLNLLLNDTNWPHGRGSNLLHIKYLTDAVRGIDLNTRPISLPDRPRESGPSLQPGPGSTVREPSPDRYLTSDMLHRNSATQGEEGSIKRANRSRTGSKSKPSSKIGSERHSNRNSQDSTYEMVDPTPPQLVETP